MHIPSSMLHGAICPVTAAVSTIGISAAAYVASKSSQKPTASRFAAITALIFAGQMMNFPIQDGTSGHLLGGVIASVLLGTPFGILATAIVLAIQCLIFSDGGFSVLGANILNMSILGAGLGGIVYSKAIKNNSLNPVEKFVKIGILSWASVMVAALACSIELGISGTVAFPKVAGAMLSTHALIGIGEAVITMVVCYAFVKEESSNTIRNVVAPFSAAVLIGMMLSPFASSFPDGLEWVAQKYQFLHDSAPAFVSPMPDYTIPAISNEVISTGLAGLAGVVITFFIAWLALKGVSVLNRRFV
ncbi:MAG: energy-coupling factor ABC transporter permease [Candidatus Omnitrophica bacterium]|nr:energy-coupling factor ABC transporter permease [Candidatus Omnitrophota bacterium]